MKNMQIAGTGNSRFMKSAISETATWEEFRDMLRAGTFPFDLNGVNDAGITERGTPYDVNSVLKDETARLLGGDDTMLPDDALLALLTMININWGACAKIAVSSYVGTGSYGSANPLNLTFGFAPQVICMLESQNLNASYLTDPNGVKYTAYNGGSPVTPFSSIMEFALTNRCTTSYAVHALWNNSTYLKTGLGNSSAQEGYYYNYAKKSADGKTLSWFHHGSAAAQFNTAGLKYHVFALGF